jgi:hypothetical protein
VMLGRNPSVVWSSEEKAEFHLVIGAKEIKVIGVSLRCWCQTK